MSCDASGMAKLAVPTTALKIRLPEDLYEHFDLRAAKFNRSIEDEIVLRLRDTLSYNAAAPIYLDDIERAELTKITGHLIRTPSDLLTWARKVTVLKVAQVEVPLGQTLATRLASRTFGTSWPEYIRSTVIRLLEQEVGLR